MKTETINGVECVQYRYRDKSTPIPRDPRGSSLPHPAGVHIYKLAQELGRPDVICGLCPAYKAKAASTCQPCVRNIGTVKVEARFVPLLRMRGTPEEVFHE